MNLILLFTAATAALAQRNFGSGYGRHGWQHMPGRDFQNVSSAGNATFSQLIDHNNPHLGTFEQFYFYDATHWGGPGSPVIMFTPGEVSRCHSSRPSCTLTPARSMPQGMLATSPTGLPPESSPQKLELPVLCLNIATGAHLRHLLISRRQT